MILLQIKHENWIEILWYSMKLVKINLHDAHDFKKANNVVPENPSGSEKQF